MTRPPRLLVSGYYGFGNAGDEAILAGLTEGLRERAPEAELTVLSGNPAATEREHGVRAVSRGLGSAFLRGRESDLLVSGGGGLLQDATSWRSPLYYLTVMRLARAAGVPVACVGQGIGPLHRGFVRRLVRNGLSRVEAIAVRDQASQEALRELGVRRPVEVTADLAFLLPRPKAEATTRAWAKAGLSEEAKPAVAIALRRPPGEPKAGLAASLAGPIGEACERLGLHPVLLPMQPGADGELAEEVAAALPMAAAVVRAGLSAREMLALVGGCELVIGMRLHALIFAAICAVPPVAISYDPKVEALMGELGLSAAGSAGALDEEALGRAIHSTWDSREEIGRRVAEAGERLRSSARRNVEIVLSLLPESR